VCMLLVHVHVGDGSYCDLFGHSSGENEENHDKHHSGRLARR